MKLKKYQHALFAYLILTATSAVAQRRPASVGVLGDTADVHTPTKGGVCVIGGGGNVKDMKMKYGFV